ncbi:hypothetical protein B0H10DRAFT_2103712 [Mycena sp. CBHHK59/15]|nr:hypothetical protein B0H10DRAFT_2103712 [Mycena sp. CBHHK59/15]
MGQHVKFTDHHIVKGHTRKCDLQLSGSWARICGSVPCKLWPHPVAFNRLPSQMNRFVNRKKSSVCAPFRDKGCPQG